ncbi:hypothetical protein Q31b_22980 [Novipirellula aureliae]|uniref:Recombination-associated protein RdgC n=1 Tax=Novipirellula aureliae TaxID=2527966 RepID=A0A5C6E2X2_9BACT|nr:hypothetical protein [Novipirellula aureliae]TWU43260.1 hypothetical protein Q31b_22980 [Novipirellula aureliae]
MPFLSGNLGFERFSIEGFDSTEFTDEHIEQLTKNAAGNVETASEENVHVGFLGGAHLFDQEFDLGKNVINDAVHVGVRIDTNQIPSAIRKAWLEIELLGYAKDSPSGVPSKSQRKDAKEAVEQRCAVEAASGKYRKMQSFPMLWDCRQDLLYFGGTAGKASGYCIDLLERVFEIELRHMSAGTIAKNWATASDKVAEMDDCMHANFVDSCVFNSLIWDNEHSQLPDFLGNEFLLWLWWKLENGTDALTLADDSEVTVMMTKTLSLECPLGENGKETISAEFPTSLAEATEAIRSGKIPRKTGLTLIREGRQFDLVLQAETFGISGAKIHLDEEEDFDVNDRIDAIRTLSETVDLMFHVFCECRVSERWNEDHEGIRDWLTSQHKAKQRVAA